LHLASELLREFGTRKVLGGLNIWIDLRTYPAVLLLYAFGIGTLKGRHYKTLFKWLTTPIDGHDKGHPAVESLFCGGWDGDGDDHQRAVWRNLEGFERHKTPLSDHLHDIFQALLSEYALGKEHFEYLFEQFEMFASLAFTTASTDAENLAELTSARDLRSVHWVPYGRSGWHGTIRDAIIEELRGTELQGELLAAGFAKGDKRFFQLSLQNLERLMSHMRRL
jgi:hypothetical protein